MKMVILIIGAVLAVGVIGIIIFLGSMGMLGQLAVEKKAMGPYIHVYESFTGPYPETGKVFDKVYNELKAMDVDTTQGLGVYYDDPREVAKEKLRSDCGVVLQEKDQAQLETLKETFKVQTLEQKESIVATFPIKSNLSYMMGPMKAYPALTKYAEQNKLEIIKTYELYDVPNNVILFVANVEDK